MRQSMLSSLAVIALLATVTYGQATLNTPFAALAINTSTSSVLNTGPTAAPVFTDSGITINIAGFPGTPVIMIFGPLSIHAFTHIAFSLDITNTGNNYANQIFVNGYTKPSPGSYTNGLGSLQVSAAIPACSTNPSTGVISCLTQASFSTTCQAITQDPTNVPFGVRSTGAATANFTNGYTQFTLSGEASATYNFPASFVFPFYGVNYTRCFVSANGFISFGTTPDTGFPSPSVSYIRGASPRIMAFYNDLVPEDTSTSPRIYAQFFVQGGVRKIKIGHERLAEFSNATGPHGGECIISEPGDISVFMHTYNALPSINTAFGISPGNNVDNGSPPAVGQTAFGRDLSVDYNNSPTFLGQNRGGFELFDHTNFPATNSMIGFAGFGFPLGIQYSPDTTLPPGQNGYFIHN